MSSSTERFHKWAHHYFNFTATVLGGRYCSVSSTSCPSEICSIKSLHLPWFCLGDTICLHPLSFSLTHSCLGGAIQQVVLGSSFSHLCLHETSIPRGILKRCGSSKSKPCLELSFNYLTFWSLSSRWESQWGGGGFTPPNTQWTLGWWLCVLLLIQHSGPLLQTKENTLCLWLVNLLGERHSPE